MDYKELCVKADTAGRAAAAKKVPTPMVVVGPVGLDNKPQAGCQSYYVPSGVCGFAWVTVRPGNSPCANYLKKLGWAKPAYGGGVQVWVSQYNQSMELKEAYAEAFAAVLRENGVNAYAGSRMD